MARHLLFKFLITVGLFCHGSQGIYQIFHRKHRIFCVRESNDCRYSGKTTQSFHQEVTFYLKNAANQFIFGYCVANIMYKEYRYLLQTNKK